MDPRFGCPLVVWSIIVLWISFPREAESGQHEDRLIKNLFKGYNPYSRPVLKEDDSVEVNFGIALQQIIDLDEKNERLITNIWLNYAWNDPKLQWLPSEYGGIETVRIPYKYVWTPDILMYNSVDDEIDSKFPTNVVVSSDGSISWIPIGIYQSACTVKIRWFPFDDQECPLKFGSWTYDATKINMTLGSVDVTGYSPSGEWDLVGTPVNRRVFSYECCPEPYVDITFTLSLRRRPLYYGFNMIIPCALISTLTLLNFCLPPGSGEKISLGINILLTLTMIAKIVADKIPATSMTVPIVGIYFACIQIVCTVSVIMTVLVLNFHHRNPDMYDMPAWVKKSICEWLAWILRVKRPGREFSRQFLIRQKKMRDLESKQPKSRSLISNVRDVDNVIPVSRLSNNDFHPFKREPSEDFGGFKSELLQILNELRFITGKMKEDSLAKKKKVPTATLR